MRVGGELSIRAAELVNPGGEALSLRQVRVDGALVLQPQCVNGGIDMTNCRAAALEDLDETWSMPTTLRLDGFTYGGLTGSASRAPAHRVEQMVALSTPFSIQPYTQLADIYRRSGDAAGARHVAWLMHWAEHHHTMGHPNWFTRAVRQLPGVPARPMSNDLETPAPGSVARRRTRVARRLVGHGVGFGYRFWRPIALATVLLIFGWGIFALAAASDGFTPTDPGAARAVSSECSNAYPCVRPFIYSLDVLLPVVDLRQDAFWVPNSNGYAGEAALWTSLVMAVLGWGVVGLAIAGAAERLRDPT